MAIARANSVTRSLIARVNWNTFGSAVAAALCALAFSVADVTWRWDNALYDQWLPVTGSPNRAAEPIIVAIDEYSLAELGQWPWSRTLHAALIDRLTEARVAAIGLDLLFAEPSADGDSYLTQAIAKNGKVVVPVVAESSRLNAPLKETLPIPEVASAAAAIGHTDLEVDPDGIVRSTFLNAGLGAAHWPNFALALASVSKGRAGAKGGGDVYREPPDNAYRWIRERPILIPFQGAPGHFARISYVDVLRGHVDVSRLAGRVVLIGATATGLDQSVSTPVSGMSRAMSSVEVLANVFYGIASQREIKPVDGVSAGALTMGTAAIALLVFASQRRLSRTLVGAAACVVPISLSFVLLHFSGYWWPPLSAMFALVLAGSIFLWRAGAGMRVVLGEQRRQAAVTLKSIADGVITTDRTGRVQFMNPVAERLVGYTSEQAYRRSIADVIRTPGENQRPGQFDAILAAIRNGEGVQLVGHFEMVARGAETDEPRGIDISVAPLRDDKGQLEGAVAALRDVTAARKLAREIIYQANHDDLTDLPNRTLLRDRLEFALKRANREDARVVVVFVDLDRFKAVNDSFGHDFGDGLLRQVATRLRGVGRAQDTIARAGGDEFVLVLESEQRAVDVAIMVRRFHVALSEPFVVNGQDVFVGASMGVSVFPRDGQSADVLMRNADIAMYSAKDSGRNAVRFFSDEMNQLVQRRAGLERELRRSLSAKQTGLMLHYQPIVNLASGKIAGVEALSRWTTREFGVVSPEEFVSVAEESGLIVDLGTWVLREACHQAMAWQDSVPNALRVSVNLSPRQLSHQDVPELVREALSRSRLAPNLLELEITENVMMQDTDREFETLTGLKRLGVGLAVDDFGTGYSSLSFLKRFPIDRLKIDKSFVRDIGVNRESTEIVRAVVAMASSLNLGLIAEGIESDAHVEFLRGHGCEEGQGFHLCTPGSAVKISEVLQANKDLRVSAT